MNSPQQLPIEDHGIIGDMRTVALVALDASIDFLCWPRFDSPSVFASLLDAERGGYFRLMPELQQARRQQLYLPDTNLLLTRFLSHEGVAEVSDFMHVAEGDHPQRLVRRIKSVRGTLNVTMRCAPRFDYGRTDHQLDCTDKVATFVASDDDAMCLRLCASVPLAVDGNDAVASFTLEPGESVAFTLDAGGDDDAADVRAVADAFKETSTWWHDWSAASSYSGRWRDDVNRSALVLKLLTSAEHGSIVAAPTFGLPETPGGERNWDYRYTWMRDAAFTVYAFLRVGHVKEANAFMRWLEGVTDSRSSDGTLNVMYRLDGSDVGEETTLEHFSGYHGALPVRIGNGAADQLQLDIYGELMDAIYLADKYGEQVTRAAWHNIRRMLAYVQDHWQNADEGIWEVRNGRQELLFSRLMCWVALDRGIRLSDKRSLPAPLDDWRRTRDDIYEDIHSNFWNADRGAFVQAKGLTTLDASCLMMPLVRFISPTDPRWLSTLAAIGEELTDDSLVYRYSIGENEDADGLTGIEGTFNMCSFWYIECLARAGQLNEARFLFEKMLGYANHLGLYAEETGFAGEQLGNFPQAFTHLALISTAHCLDRLL